MVQVGHGGRRKKSKTGEIGGYHTAQVVPGDRGRKKSKKKKELIRFGFDLDLIWIEIAVFKNKTFQGISPLNCNKNIF